ncbi:hypothetical protein G6Z94_09255 [Vibrio aestuarianus]|uniref:hypothetical protein n=1 Tax=Vibrio aestuarianus TaxID=28171 RepID=UPI001592E3B1|nr:hypothetical protein [Vibrio aestuarianus]NGZ17530.1 hypothetical protein [Vibrio aestuarianus]
MNNAQLKHQAPIYSVFEIMFESWMNDDEKREFIDLVLQRAGITLSELDESIEEGVKNGYSVEEQLAVVRLLMHGSER